MKKNSKQMRVSEVQYEILGELSKKLKVSRVEVLNNLINLGQFIESNGAKTVKILDRNNEEKEICLSVFIGRKNEG